MMISSKEPGLCARTRVMRMYLTFDTEIPLVALFKGTLVIASKRAAVNRLQTVASLLEVGPFVPVEAY